MALSPGLRLGPYEIIAPAGVGGMGEAYRAHDSRLNRDVAIKVTILGVRPCKIKMLPVIRFMRLNSHGVPKHAFVVRSSFPLPLWSL